MAMVLSAALQCAMIAAVAAAPVTFKVGLGGRQAAPEGLHSTGSFQGWDPAATAMEDADMDQIFEVTLELPEGRYEFKFINGNTFEQAEEVPESCSEVDSTHFNRYISVASDGAPEEVHVCFSACMPCGELPTCKQFNCAAGFASKPAMSDYPGDSQASCCDQVPNDLKGVVVRSAGWSDGNRAEFWMNGDLSYATGTRGLTVVELLPKSQTAPVLERLGSFCAPTGRAAGHGCAVATNSFTMAGGTLGAMFSRFNALLTEALQTRKTPTLRYVDIYTLGASMPEETVQGHGTQILQLWTWQALLGGFCPSSIARPESQVQFDGPLCWKTSVTDLAECKTYSTYTGSSFWQCLNSQPCSLTVVSTQTSAATSTVTTTTMARFEPVDGGVGRACRGSSSSDNSAQYFDVVSVPTLDECKESCTMKQECVGVEYSGGRCESWTRPEGIEASIPLDGFTCLRLVRNLPSSTILSVTTTNTISPYFFPVDGGIDRACRGASSSDNLPSNYYVVGGIYELADCQEACLQAQLCVGIEFSAGRCEVWTRPNGIQASIALGGFTCMRYSMENDAAQKRRLFLAPREHSGYYA